MRIHGLAKTLGVILSAGTLGGCSTVYVAHLRQEYNEKGRAYGIYYGEDEYPRAYPATRLSTTVVIPSMIPCWDGMLSSARFWFGPINIPLSIADFAVSVVSDTVMFPYDIYKACNREEDKMEKGTDSKTVKDRVVEALEEGSIGMTDHPVLPLVGSENVQIPPDEENTVGL